MSISDQQAKQQVENWYQFSTFYSYVNTQLENVLQSNFDLSVVEYRVLDALKDQNTAGHLRMQELSEKIMLSSSATTRLVNRLEDRKLLSRFICPEDRRGIYTEITGAGKKVLAKAQDVYLHALQNALAGLQAADKFTDVVRLITN